MTAPSQQQQQNFKDLGDTSSMDTDLPEEDQPTSLPSIVVCSLLNRRDSADEGQCALKWKNLSLDLVKKKGPPKQILKETWGEALPYETTAIMGASGAGKTSLFDALSGRIPVNGKFKLNGDIRFGDVKVDYKTNIRQVQKRMAFVAQLDTLHEASTPREAIRFSARLRLPRDTSDEEIERLVSSYLTDLGLNGCADSLIGGRLKKGISGGEKKRTSIGVELVTDPSVILLDEPTSGLDSFSANQLMQLLEKIARAGNTVLFTIHQPSSQIFFSFDRLILLHGGRLMYTGKSSEVPNDFKRRGYAIPQHVNPADWILDVAQTYSEDELKKAEFFPVDERIDEHPTTDELPVDTTITSSFGMQLHLLLQREWRTAVRIPVMFIVSLVISVLIGTFSGILFYKVGEGNRNDAAILQGITGTIVNGLLNSMMGQSTGALILYATERPLFLREYSTSTFGITPYVLSQWVMEIFKTVVNLLIQSLLVYYLTSLEMEFFTFFGISIITSLNATSMASLLGSSVDDPTMATAMFPIVILPQFYFSGVLVAISLIPSWLRWFQYACALRYATALCLGYELDSCGAAQESCDAFLDVMSVHLEDRAWFWIAFVMLFGVFKAASIVLLMIRGCKI